MRLEIKRIKIGLWDKDYGVCVKMKNRIMD